MKRLLCFLLLLALLVPFAACGEVIPPRNCAVLYASGLEAQAQNVAEALTSAGFTVIKTTEYASDAITESSEDAEAELFIIGFAERGSITAAVEGMGIHDYCVKKLDDCVYIGGRADCDSTDKAVTLFTAECLGEEGEVTEKTVTNQLTLDKATVNGHKLSDYKIICADIDKPLTYTDVAEDINLKLEAKLGAKLAVGAQSDEETELEIIVGSAVTRTISKQYRGVVMEYDKSLWHIDGGKIVITGGSVSASHAAFLSFIEYLESCEGTVHEGEKRKVDTCEVIKVACVGDSITQGDSPDKCYPAYLQEMLGFGYCVENFGLSGYSTRKKDPYPYIGTPQYNAAIKFGADIVLYMLGTNDCQPTKKWSENTATEYNEAANFIFDALEAANENVKIYVALPSSLFPNTVWNGWEIWRDSVKEHAVPLNRQLATDRGYDIIDVYSWSLENPAVFADGLHPHQESYRDLAGCFYDGMTK